MAQQGHAAGAAGHNAAITALGLHLVFAAVWLGGLLTIVLLRDQLDGERLPIVLARYSTVALICFIVVAALGLRERRAPHRHAGTSSLTPYGVLVIVEGRRAHRARPVRCGAAPVPDRADAARLAHGARRGIRRRDFWWLVVVELAFMGLASGVAAALARTATPVSEDAAGSLARTPAEILTGEPLPPWPDVDPLLHRVEPRPASGCSSCGFGIFFYLAGVRRLRQRGDHWPIYRAVLWVAGLLLLALRHERRRERVRAVPLLGAHGRAHGAHHGGAGAARARRAGDARGARHPPAQGRLARRPRVDPARPCTRSSPSIIANPIVAAVLFAGSLWVFYYSPLFRWSMLDHIGHEWMIGHFLITGYLFVQSLIGIDPVPYRLPYPFRLLLLLGTMAFHAFFGLAIMSGTGLLLADWYGAMGWGTDAARRPAARRRHRLVGRRDPDGRAGDHGRGAVVRAATRRSRSDSDRHADRTGDAELEAYNARLAAIAEQDAQRG